MERARVAVVNGAGQGSGGGHRWHWQRGATAESAGMLATCRNVVYALFGNGAKGSLLSDVFRTASCLFPLKPSRPSLRVFSVSSSHPASLLCDPERSYKSPLRPSPL